MPGEIHAPPPTSLLVRPAPPFSAFNFYGGALKGDEYTDLAARELTWIISTDEPHRNDNVVITAGIGWTYFDLNPVFLLSHDDGSKNPRALPLGKWTRRAFVNVNGGTPGVIMRAQYLPSDLFGDDESAEWYRLASTVFKMAVYGAINTTSFGWMPSTKEPPKLRKTGGRYFGQCEALEGSQTIIPNNRSATRVTAAYSDTLGRGVEIGACTAEQAEELGRFLGDARVYALHSETAALAGGAMNRIERTSEWTHTQDNGTPADDSTRQTAAVDGDPATGNAGDPAASDPPPADAPADDSAPTSDPASGEDPTETDGGEEPAADPGEDAPADPPPAPAVAPAGDVPAESAGLSLVDRYVAEFGSAEVDTAVVRARAAAIAMMPILSDLGILAGTDGLYTLAPAVTDEEAIRASALRKAAVAYALVGDLATALETIGALASTDDGTYLAGPDGETASADGAAGVVDASNEADTPTAETAAGRMVSGVNEADLDAAAAAIEAIRDRVRARRAAIESKRKAAAKNGDGEEEKDDESSDDDETSTEPKKKTVDAKAEDGDEDEDEDEGDEPLEAKKKSASKKTAEKSRQAASLEASAEELDAVLARFRRRNEERAQARAARASAVRSEQTRGNEART